MGEEILESPPQVEGNDQFASAGTEVEPPSEDDLEDAEDQDDEEE